MQGSYRERRPGVWELRVSTGKDVLTGRYGRVTKTIEGKERDAKRELRDLVGEVERGQHRHRDKTVAELLDRWLELGERRLSPTTVRTYRSYIDNRIRPALGDHRLLQLTVEDLDRFYAALEDDGMAPASVRQCHAILRRALRQATIWKWIPVNPAAGGLVTLPASRELEVAAPVTGQVERLIAEALKGNDVVLAIAIFLASALGARRGEVCALRWTDVDFKAGTVTIARAVVNVAGDLVEKETVVRTLTNVGGALYEKDTKTHQRRTPLLEAEHLEILAGYLEYQQTEAAKAGVEHQADGYIVSRCPAACHPVDPNEITSLFRAPVRRLRMKVRFHDLRHFHATELLDKGVPLPTVSKRLGHRWTSTTANIYGHGTEAGDRQAAAIAGEIVPAAALGDLRRSREVIPGPDAQKPPALEAGGDVVEESA